MGLIKCKECGNQLSNKASTCPACGAPANSSEGLFKKIGCGGVLVLFFFVIIMGNLGSQDKSKNLKTQQKKPVAAQLTPEQARQKKIESCFSAWDGSHTNLTRIIKKSMNDPKSYNHDKTVYWDKGDHLIVKTTFRGKNAFGGVVVNWISAKSDLDGNITEIIAQGP